MHDETIVEEEIPAAIRLAALRAMAEVDLLGAVLARPAELVAVAQSEGIAQWDFGQDDLRLIWLAILYCVQDGLDKGKFRAAARFALQHGDLWDATQIGGNWHTSMLWSDASLERLFTSAYPDVSLVRQRAQRLLYLVRAQELTQKLLDRAEGIIQSAISPISPGLRRAG